MNYKKYKLKNGLTVILKHKESKGVLIQINVNVGSIYEKEKEKGYSHLVEHMLFEGTKKRQNAQIITSEIENLGGEVNAATSNEQTYYYIKIPFMSFKKGIDVISDMVINSTFEENTIKKEKNIVLEEIKMVNDQPRYFQWILFEKNLLKGTEYEEPVYGKIKDVSCANKNKLIKFYKEHYKPNNATLIIVGNIKSNLKEIEKEIENKFNEWENIKSNKKLKLTKPVNKERKIKSKKDIQQIYLIKGVVTPKVTSKDSPVIEVIEAILGKPQSGRMNTEIRTKHGLAYDVSVSYDNYKHFGIFTISIGSDKTRIKDVQKIIKKELLLENLTNKEVEQAISYIEGKTLLEKDNIHHEADNIIFWESIANKDLSKEYLNAVKQVTIKDIKRVSKKLFNNFTEIQIIPKK